MNLVEGNKGLYDGLSLDGSNSNAALAKLLDLPVFLVIDARGMTRGIAPLILGYQAFDKDIQIAGVILNKLGGSRHEAKLREVIEHYTDVPVVGAIQYDERLEHHRAPSRPDAKQRIARRHGEDPADRRGRLPSRSIWTSCWRCRARIRLPVTAQRRNQPAAGWPTRCASASPATAPSASITPTTSMRWKRPARHWCRSTRCAMPACRTVDALYIGGGFPEACAAELEANTTLRSEIRQAIASGMPAYAECGGLMYLSRGIAYQGRTYEMVGAIPGDVVMHAKPVGRGYVHLKEERGPSVAPPGGTGQPDQGPRVPLLQPREPAGRRALRLSGRTRPAALPASATASC